MSQRQQQATQHATATPAPEHEPSYLPLIKRILEVQGLRREWAAHAFASPQRVLRASREFAYRLTKLEHDYASVAQFSPIVTFYAELAQRIKQAPRNEAYLQIGWGTGWHAKTIGPLLKLTQAGQELLAALVKRFQLDRGRGSTPFPKTRRYIEQDGQPVLPLGWVRIRIPELAEEPTLTTTNSET